MAPPVIKRRKMASSSSSSSSTKVISLKLLIDTKSERVLFAEASKDFIDFLFNLLGLPIGRVTYMLTQNHMVGSMGKLYESVKNLSDDYLLNPNHDKHILLKPSAPLISGHLLLPANDHQDLNNNCGGYKTWTYKCVNGCGYTLVSNTPCRCKNVNGGFGGSGHFSFGVPTGGFASSSAFSFTNRNNVTKTKTCADGGFVKGGVTYTVMDDLEVCPMSTISTITLLSKFNIKDITSLQEKIVKLDKKQGIELLKASLQCNNVLTSVFLKNGGA